MEQDNFLIQLLTLGFNGNYDNVCKCFRFTNYCYNFCGKNQNIEVVIDRNTIKTTWYYEKNMHVGHCDETCNICFATTNARAYIDKILFDLNKDGKFVNPPYDYIVFADGGFSTKHNVGAYAFVIVDANGEKICEKAKKVEQDTHNRLKLISILKGLENLPQDAKKVLVVSDLQYAVNTLNGVWARKANKDIFDVYEKFIGRTGLKVEYKWVKSHTSEMLTYANDLCNNAAGVDVDEEFQKYKKMIK